MGAMKGPSMTEQIPPISEQTGPPPLVEDLHDTDDLPEGFDIPSQSTEPDFELDDTKEETV